MDNGTKILLFNIWAILLGLFLLRAYQSRSVRIQMIRTFNRFQVQKHRLKSGLRWFRGRLLIGLGRALLWAGHRLEATDRASRKAGPQGLPARLLRSLFGSLFGFLPWFFVLRLLAGHAPGLGLSLIYFATICILDEAKFQRKQWRERQSESQRKEEAQPSPGQPVADRNIAEEDSV
ncbi:MAG TPA: hypothetical protein VKU00_33940 [Chthonomonadaceae bacterium]|nr:hypothetical protein [Chthonomonadaceae bacterium]